MGAALRGKDFLVSDSHFPPTLDFIQLYKLRMDGCTDFVWCTGLGSARAGVEAADWRGHQLE